MALIGHPVVNDKQYTYGFAAQMLRSGRAAQHIGQGAQGGEDSCNEVECDADAEMCMPDEADTSCSTSSDSSLVGHESPHEASKQIRPCTLEHTFPRGMPLQKYRASCRAVHTYARAAYHKA